MQSYDEILRSFLGQSPQAGEGNPDPGAWRTPGEYRKVPEREPDSNYLGGMVGKRPNSYTPGDAWQAIKDFFGYTDIKEGINQLGEGNYLEGATQTGVGIASAVPFSPLKGLALAKGAAELAPLAAGAGILLGRRARGTNLTELQRAEDLHVRDEIGNLIRPRESLAAEETAQNEAIRQKTGWSRLPGDREWRTEISDVGSEKLDIDNYLKALRGDVSSSSLGLTGFPTLSTIMPNHPRLYSAYPGAANIEVLPRGRGSARGGYSTVLDQITVDPKLLPDPYNPTPMTAKQQDTLWSTLLHEVTHAIQTREGFARGGSMKEFFPQNYDDLQRNFNAAGGGVYRLGIQNSLPEGLMVSAMKRVGAGIVNPSYYKNFPGLEAALQKYKEAHTQIQGVRDEAWNQYRRLAGEAEARLVQSRRFFSPEELKALPIEEGLRAVEPNPLIYRPSDLFTHQLSQGRGNLIESRDTLLGDLIRPTRTMPPPRKDFLSYR